MFSPTFSGCRQNSGCWSKRVPVGIATERDSNSISAVTIAACGIRQGEYCYEEGPSRGAF
jgi:hypothetical protein